MKKTVSCLLICLLLCTAGCKAAEEAPEAESPAVKVIGTLDTLVEPQDLKQKEGKKEIGFQLEPPEAGEEIAIVTMRSGDTFKLRFFPDEAPKAVYNFKVHALQGYYDGLLFHRIMENFMLQGGDPEGTGKGGESVWGEDFEDEFSPSLCNIDGAVSMANRGADTNRSQFFINCTNGLQTDWENYQKGFEVYEKDPDQFTSVYGKWVKMDLVSTEMKNLYNAYGGNLHLDGYYSTTGEGHTVFAQVFEGMKSVKKLGGVSTDPENDYRPLKDVVIRKIEIVPYEP